MSQFSRRSAQPVPANLLAFPRPPGILLLGHLQSYARDGHGGNVALRELAYDSAAGETTKTDHARHFVFSLRRVFGSSTPSTEVDSAESHYQDALMTRQFGLNRN